MLVCTLCLFFLFFVCFFQAEDGIRDRLVTGVRTCALPISGCQTATSLDAAIELAGETERPIFISGGGELYRQAMPLADVLHLTTIHLEVSGDIFFPEVPEAFKLLEEKHYSSNINYTYRRFERRAKL